MRAAGIGMLAAGLACTDASGDDDASATESDPTTADDSASASTDVTDGDCAGQPGCDCAPDDSCVPGYVCFDGQCMQESLCGNGLAELDEACDDGNAAENDGCSPDCTKTAVPDWVERHNGPDGNGDDAALDVSVGADDEVFVVGYQDHVPQGQNILLLKYSFQGQLFWAREWDGPAGGDDIGYGIALDSAGNILVAGITDAAGAADLVVLRFDGDGGELWSETVSADGLEAGYAIAVDENDDVFVAGVATNGADEDIWVGQWYADGTPGWTSAFAGESGGKDAARDLAIAPDGGVLVTGTLLVAGQGQDVWLAELGNNVGDESWSQRVNAGALDTGWGIAADPDGNVLVGATIGGGSEAADILVGKYDGAGTEIWMHQFTGPGQTTDEARDLAVDAEGRAIVAGFRVLGQPNLSDGWFRALSPDGEVAWTHTYNGPSSKDDEAHGVAVDAAGAILVVGSEYSEAQRLDAWVGRFLPG